ncbi:MAG: DNA-directed RNA polymerase subunit omega [Candidatus Omnitrophota bacterium]
MAQGIQDILDKSDNSVYKLVIMASKRALEIAEGQPRLVNLDANIKPSTVALAEIAENKVRYKKPKD